MVKMEIDEAKFKEMVDMKVKEELENNKPKVNEKDPQVSVSEFINHQRSCNTGDCPLCKAMNDKVNAEKIGNTISKIERLDKKFSEHTRREETIFEMYNRKKRQIKKLYNSLPELDKDEIKDMLK